MSTPTVYTETVLAELAYLVASRNGDSSILNAPAGLRSFFECSDVIEAGHELYTRRQQQISDPADARAFTDYFDTVGSVICASTASFSVTGSAATGVTRLYFAVPSCTVELVIAGGRAAFALQTDATCLHDLVMRAVGTEPEVTVIGRFCAGQDDRYLAISCGAAAYSSDGQQWQTGDPSDRRSADEILGTFISIG